MAAAKAKGIITVRRDAVLLQGGRRHGACYYADEWAEFVRIEAEAGRPLPYRRTDKMTDHPTASPIAICTVWVATD